jgi:hypothetical protein
VTMILSRRALNRATLARQGLVERRTASALSVIDDLIGMQSQAPLAPYVGLWSRLVNFDPAELVSLMHSREVVRMVLMRGTIHLVRASDALGIRPLIQEVLHRGAAANKPVAALLASIDVSALTAAGHRLLTSRALDAKALAAALAAEFPGHDPALLSRAVRDLVPGIQVPPRGIWGKGGQPVLTTPENWLGRPVEAMPIDALVLRYLKAFGPASVVDVQAWSGLTRLSEVLDRLRPQLRTYKDESNGRELFDLAHVELPDPDQPVPIRFVAEYDNLLLSHADRTRVISDEHRRQVITINGIVKGTVLYDGFVAATWKAETTRKSLNLRVSPLGRLPKSCHAQVVAEGNRLLTFLTPEGSARDIQLDV